MKIETKEYETRKVEVIKNTKYYCDKCKEEFKVDTYSKDKNKIVFQKGDRDPYDGSGHIEGHQAYLCEKCGIIIKSLLEQNGIKFEEFDIWW
jgi:hypothetical protein